MPIFFSAATFDIQGISTEKLLESGIRSGAVVTDVEVDDFVRLRDQKRDIAYVTVEAAGFLGDADPADEE